MAGNDGNSGQAAKPFDPFRKLKMDFFCILASQQEPISVSKLLHQYEVENHEHFDAARYGFRDVHHFLRSYPETFIATNELTQDLTRCSANRSDNPAASDIQEQVLYQRPQGMKSYPVPPSPVLFMPPSRNVADVNVGQMGGQQSQAANLKTQLKSSTNTVLFNPHKLLEEQKNASSYGTVKSNERNSPGKTVNAKEQMGTSSPSNYSTPKQALHHFTGTPIMKTNFYTPPDEEHPPALRSLHPSEINALLKAVQEKGANSVDGLRFPVDDSLHVAEKTLGSSIGGKSNPISYIQLLASLKSCSLSPSAEFTVKSIGDEDYIVLKTKENKRSDVEGCSTENSPYKFTAGAKRLVTAHMQKARVDQDKKASVVPSLKQENVVTKKSQDFFDFDGNSDKENETPLTGKTASPDQKNESQTDIVSNVESSGSYSHAELRRLSNSPNKFLNQQYEAILQNMRLKRGIFTASQQTPNDYQSPSKPSPVTESPNSPQAEEPKNKMNVEDILKRLLISPEQKTMFLSALQMIKPSMTDDETAMVHAAIGLDQ